MKRYSLFFAFINISLIIHCSGPSSLDTSFNQSGSVELSVVGGINQGQDIAVQIDGKIVSVGYAGDNALIVRFNNDGTLDTNFNKNGQESGEPGTVIITLGYSSVAHAVTLEPITNKIIIAGSATPNHSQKMAFIARYNPDGSPDTSFNPSNGNGIILTTFNSQSELFDVKLDASNNIIVAGSSIYQRYTNALIARFTNSGTLDTTFNTTGYVTTLLDTSLFTKAHALAIQSNGKIVITGQAEIDENQQLIMIRYNSNGSLDTSATPFNDLSFSSSKGTSLAIQDDGKIIIAGSVNPEDLPSFEHQLYTIIRLNSDGTLDTTFNATGEIPGSIISGVGLQATGVAIQSNGQIVTCGFNYITNYIVLIIRYDNDGSIDPTFNFAIDQATSNTIGSSVVIQLDGKIIVSGTITPPVPQA